MHNKKRKKQLLSFAMALFLTVGNAVPLSAATSPENEGGGYSERKHLASKTANMDLN